MYEAVDRPRYVIPGLAGIYAGLETYSWPLIRVATGLFFVPHGMQKLFGFWGGDLSRTAEGFAKQGLEPAMFWATYIGNLTGARTSWLTAQIGTGGAESNSPAAGWSRRWSPDRAGRKLAPGGGLEPPIFALTARCCCH